MRKKKLKGKSEGWPVEMRSLASIIPYQNNPRRHPQSQIKHLAKLLLKYPIDQPIVVDEDGVILKGHGRRLAAIEARIKQFPVVVHKGLSDADKSAMRIADNQSALLAGWDTAVLQSEVWSLPENFDMDLLGFENKDLQDLLKPKDGGVDPDEAPEAPSKPVVRLGDIWQLGEHRMLCGDATNADAWQQLMGGLQAAMVFTDPPYGVSYDKSADFGIIAGDEKRQDDLYLLVAQSMTHMVTATSDAAAFYIWHASATRNDFSMAMTAAGLIERQYLIWAKSGVGVGFSDYQWCHEPCFYASKADKKPLFYGDAHDKTVWRVAAVGQSGDRSIVVGGGLLVLDGKGHKLFLQSKHPKLRKLREVRLTADKPTLHVSDQVGTVWEVSRDRDYVHPTQKPVELATRAIANSSKRGEIVLDGFSGAFSTGIGCEILGRRCYAIEIDPAYVEAGIVRWENFTGKTAVDEAGETLEARRHAAGHSGKSAGRKHAGGKNSQQRISQGSNARQPRSRRSAVVCILGIP